MPKTTTKSRTKYPTGKKQPTPLQLTQRVKDISTTERGTFKTCRRRWHLEVIENLAPRVPKGMALDFGSGIHEALEAYYLRKADTPEYLQSAADNVILDAALNAWDKWYYWADERIVSDKELMTEAKVSLGDALVELGDLGEEMLKGYHQYAHHEDDFTVHAIEGTLTGAGTSWLNKHFEEREHIAEHSESAVVLHKPSGRLLCPILDPETRQPLPGRPCLSAKIDLLVLRRPEGVRGLWVYDHKSSESQPNDRGLDFDDQATGYTYVVWRWLGMMPRGVCFNYLIKQAPKEPRILKAGNLSAAKDQLTTAQKYKAELQRRGLMLKDGTIKNPKYRGAYEALLSYGWDRFFTRHYVMKNINEMLNFEYRLVDEYYDMLDVKTGDLAPYPNMSRLWCPRCEMAPICLAMEDGSDVESIIDTRYMQAPDRKASRRI
ncbi:MAG TPA: PD-(D/E)XK nuclease family protein [Scandinavium sp.]|jgi:hypothetical protein|uniref:PD-(D/E)XK nuclease family protein n=1 Tax=Scandinavium sp. TaxID=2830653 RepID=UPI002E36B811|nr:PD-(D/E)XK nuclease family protein [Scandinavium sp.]HEX4503381.1 PD-(D/E)XK nuclease family protein [Scandinavium sp.]